MRRALSVMDVLNTKRNLLQFTDEFERSFGRPEVTGSWIIWGGSGSGKTTFILQLCKYLCRFGRVAYNSLEEGKSASMQKAFQVVGMKEVRRQFLLLDREPMEEMKERLRRRKAPKMVVIDSWQYTMLMYLDYIKLLQEFPDTLFIIIAHEKEGTTYPEGAVARKIRYNSNIKIRVDGYVAFPVSRYGGGAPFISWAEKAKEYHGFQIMNN